MKQLITTLLFAAIGCMATAQKKDWKEMHAFHAIMSITFHPAEEDNLQPVKDSASALLKAAKTWQASAVPEGYNAASVKPVLKRLVAECSAIKDGVKSKKQDADLKAMITTAHDTFHEIMEKCKN